MKNWKTSGWAAVAAIGSIMEKRPEMPPWVWMIGEILSTVGILMMGVSAADRVKLPKTGNTDVISK